VSSRRTRTTNVHKRDRRQARRKNVAAPAVVTGREVGEAGPYKAGSTSAYGKQCRNNVLLLAAVLPPQARTHSAVFIHLH